MKSVFQSTAVLWAICLLGITSAHAQVTFTLDKTSYLPGDTIAATWTDGPGSPTDWVGIYPRGVVPDGDPGSTYWRYVNGTQTATVAVPDGAIAIPASVLGEGLWSAHFLANDGYTQITGAVDFVIDDGIEDPLLVMGSIRRHYAVASQAYTGKLSAYARARDGGTLTFTKSAGPAWLSVSADGTLSGTPSFDDLGEAIFTIDVTDSQGIDQLEVRIVVFAPGAVDVPVLKVLAFNVWVGATRVSDGYNKGRDSVILSDADVVAVSENNGRAAEWAADLGWHAYQSGSDDAVLSRYPLTANFTANASVGSTVQIAAAPQRQIQFWSCHFSAYPYGPYDARDEPGDSSAKIAAAIASETDSGRLAQVNSFVSAAAAQLDAADAEPVLLLGDFNCPSHLDWTQAAADAGRNFGLVVDWPVTRATEAAGMIDAYRFVHPNPVAMPGTTWTPIDPGDVQDRIDMVHFKGAPLSVTDSQVFTTIDVGRWPSDHAGNLTTFALAPVDEDGDRLADAWEVRHFDNIASQGAGDDPDNDGYDNFSERAFALDPNSGHDTGALRIEINAGARTLRYRRIDRELEYVVEASTDLQNWSAASSEILSGESVSPIGGGVEEVTFSITEAAGDFQFFRVRAM